MITNGHIEAAICFLADDCELVVHKLTEDSSDWVRPSTGPLWQISRNNRAGRLVSEVVDTRQLIAKARMWARAFVETGKMAAELLNELPEVNE